jgi:hypothetical protein
MKRDAERLKAQRKERARAKESLKTLGEWTKEAQREVNKFVRERDSLNNRPCIVHGWDCPNHDSGYDAGHFQGAGKQPALRFNTWNIHKQCRSGNRGSHKYSKYGRGQDDMYEENLRKRIGDDRVDWLKGPHKPKQYRVSDLKRIKRIFSKRARLYRSFASK